MRNRVMVGLISSILVIGFVVIILGLVRRNGSKESALNIKMLNGLIAQDKLDDANKLLDETVNKSPHLDWAGRVYFDLAERYEKKNEIVKARDIYDKILNNYQNIDRITEVQDKLGRLNVNILFSAIITDNDIIYKVQPGDTLSKIANEFGTTVDLIKASNSLKRDVIQPNSRLKISKLKYKILVDKSQNILTLLSYIGRMIKVYHVATGVNNSTPVGTFSIINKIKDPVWFKEGIVVPAESPDNILGTRWLGFSEPGYGIHGTIEPESIGRQATQGCVRMLNPEVNELWTIVPIGTEVTIVE